MFGLSTGLSALRASQTALDTVAHNVANANDPNYHRQVTDLASRPGIERQGLFIGGGVDAVNVRRLRDDGIAKAISRVASEQNANAARLGIARQVETVLSPSVGSLNNRLDEFLNELERLTANPHDPTSRRSTVQRAEALATEFNSVSQQLNDIDREIVAEARNLVTEVNRLAGDVVELNHKISEQELQGKSPNDLLDARDRILNELSQLIDARVEQQGAAGSVVILGDHGLIGRDFVPLESVYENGTLVVKPSGDDTPLEISGGKLGGLLSAQNEVTGAIKNRIDGLAQQFIAAINEVHATGVGLDGAFQQLRSERAAEASVPLSLLELPFEIETGSVFVSVLNEASGERTTHEIAIAPDVQSLQDVAATFSGVDHLQSVVDSQTGQLIIRAESGFAFDFTGATETRPQTASITGTSEPKLHGPFTGTTNESYTIEIPLAGTVGVTAGLTAEVKNSTGELIATLDIGEGYGAGTPLEIVGGGAVSFSAGDLNSGDSFTTQLVGQPDTSGLLVALGFNGLFNGQDASTIRVRTDVVGNPDLFATTRTGEPGDTTNLESLIAVRNQLHFGARGTTASVELQDLVSSAGFEVEQLSQVDNQLSLAREHLDTQRNALSGVDPNEELVHMLQFQRAFQVASRFISTVDQTLAELIAIVG